MKPDSALILYDGACGLCHRANQFIIAQDKRRIFRFASIQGEIGQRTLDSHGIAGGLVDTFYLIICDSAGQETLSHKSTASLAVAQMLDWPWRALVILRVFPRSLRDALYDIVARNRQRYFTNYESCLTNNPELAERFLDR